MIKRKYERLPALLFVQILEDGTTEIIGKGVVVNISFGGFLVETETPLQKGRKYKCLFEIPTTYTGEVAWNNSQGKMRQYGLKFSGLSFLDKFMLKRFLKGPRRNRHT